MTPRVVAIIQARLNSRRFPEKVAQNLNGHNVLQFLVSQLAYSKNINHICVALPNDSHHKEFANTINMKNISIFFGDELDVYSRYLGAARECEAEVVVRVTGDCPLIDPNIVDNVIESFLVSKDFILASNSHPPMFPDGLDCEVLFSRTLYEFNDSVCSSYDREHVTSFFYRNFPEKVFNFEKGGSLDSSKIRVTLDEVDDLRVIREIIKEAKTPDGPILLRDIIKTKIEKPEIFEHNSKVKRNEGSTFSAGFELYQRAKKLIPGATMLFSKRAENFHFVDWPTYYSRAKGNSVWDLNGKEFKDFSLMGVGANSLGYANDEVDEAVITAIHESVSSTLINVREVHLAEKLIPLHEGAEMIRFTRTGGEASAVAVRIARSYTKRERILMCGYHGWHDFYLSANLSGVETLRDQLMPGLKSGGVPSALRGTSETFTYNDFDSFNKALSSGEIAAVIMEVQRNYAPKNGFLEHVRNETYNKGIVLIFDECSSGFRETLGGIHRKWNVNPDILILGKALGNGYAINSVSGSGKIMNSMQDSFVSSTSWSEGVGLAAGLAVYEIMERTSAFNILTEIGRKVRNAWTRTSEKFSLPIQTFGIDAMPSFSFDGDNDRLIKTLFTQLMLEKSFLATTSFNASTSHTEDDLLSYTLACEEAFESIANALDTNSVSSLLRGQAAQAHFYRLN